MWMDVRLTYFISMQNCSFICEEQTVSETDTVRVFHRILHITDLFRHYSRNFTIS
jgi:hypothetical protein